MKGKIWIILMLAGTLVSCAKNQPQATAPAEPELPTVAVTLWSDRTELFMEYPALVAGENAGFAVHLTDLATYRPLGEGTATLEFESGGQVTRFESKAPSRPGIFRVDVRLDRAGDYRAVLKVRAPKLRGSARSGGICRIRKQGRGYCPDKAGSPSGGDPISEGAAVGVRVCDRGGGSAQDRRVAAGAGRRPDPRRRRRERHQPGSRALVAFAPAPDSREASAAGRSDCRGHSFHRPLLRIWRASSSNSRRRKRIWPRRAACASDWKACSPTARFRPAEWRRQRPTKRRRRREFRPPRKGWRSSNAAGRAPTETKAVPAHSKSERRLSGIVTSLSAVTGGSVEAGQEILHITDIDRVWVVAEVPESEAEVLQNLKRAELQIGSGIDRNPGRAREDRTDRTTSWIPNRGAFR